MKVLVCVKRVIDAYVKVRLKSDHSGVEKQGVKMSMNPFDEIACEEAIRLKEAKDVDEVAVLSIGNKAVQETIRHGLALGADKGIHIASETSMPPLVLAKLMKAYITANPYDLVILGKQSIDGDHNQTGQMLAALMNWPQATFASRIEMQDQALQVTREVDGGLETIQLQLPAVVTTDLRLNEPRYATLPNIMKAKSKPMDIIAADSLGVSLNSAVQVASFELPPTRKAGIKVDSVDSLVDKLKHEAQVL